MDLRVATMYFHGDDDANPKLTIPYFGLYHVVSSLGILYTRSSEGEK